MENTKTEPVTITFLELQDSDFEGPKGFETIRNEISDTTRWEIVHDIILKRKSDSTFWAGGYCLGATECQDTYEEQELEWVQVYPVEKTITVYETKT